MSSGAGGILLLDPSGELLKAASREMRVRREAACFVKTVQEALAWRRRHGAVAVLVAPASRADGAMKAVASRPAPVLVTYGRGDVPRGAFRALPGAPSAEFLVAAVEDALTFAHVLREGRRTALVLQRTRRQLLSLRRQGEGAAGRIRRLADANVRLHETAAGLVRLMAVVSECGDPDLPGHGERTARVAVALGRRMGMPQQELDDLRLAATLHDVGELREAKEGDPSGHAQRGARMLEGLPFPQAVIDGVRWHHERYDGRGNVSGLQGSALPRIARLLALADAFVDLACAEPACGEDDMGALSPGDAARMLRATASRVHDPQAVEALSRLVADEDELFRLGLRMPELTGAFR